MDSQKDWKKYLEENSDKVKTLEHLYRETVTFLDCLDFDKQAIRKINRRYFVQRIKFIRAVKSFQLIAAFKHLKKIWWFKSYRKKLFSCYDYDFCEYQKYNMEFQKTHFEFLQVFDPMTKEALRTAFYFKGLEIPEYLA